MKYSVWEVMKYPNLAHLDPQLFPRILEEKNGRRTIETVHIVPYICDESKLSIDSQTKREVYTRVQKPGYVGVWLVFDWNNELKLDCLDGKCVISKTDSIAFIKMPYPGMNDYNIEYFMDLCTNIDKYLVDDKTFSINNLNNAHDYRNINYEVASRLIQYNEMLNSSQVIIPGDIQEILRKENLIGGVIYNRKDGARQIGTSSLSGNIAASRCTGQIIEKGLLQKIQI